MAKEKRLISVDAHKLEGLLSDCFDVIKSVKPTQLPLMGALQVWIGCCKNQPTVDAVEVPDKELRKAINLLIKQYEHSKNSDYVHNPVAHAFYYTWKQLDDGRRE